MPLVVNLAGTSFSDTSLPILYRDPMVAAGTQFLFDFKNTYSWSGQNAPTNGAVFKNLVNGGADAAWANGAADGYAGGGAVISASAGYLNIGTGYTGLYTGLNKFAVGCTVGMPAAFVASFYPGFFGRAVNTGTLVARMDLELTGRNLRVNQWSLGDYQQVLNTSTVYDIISTWEPSGVNAGTAKVFVDGVLVRTSAIGNTTLPVAGVAGTPWVFGNAGMGGGPDFKGRLFRCFAEDMTISNRTPEQIAAANWAVVNGRFIA